MTAHPGKKLLFMGQEFGQWREWRDEHSLDWHLLDDERHRSLQVLNRELNRLYCELASLHVGDADPAGFAWIDPHNVDQSVFAFLRRDPTDAASRPVVCVFNATPVPRDDYWIGVPEGGAYLTLLDTDEARFGGSSYSRVQRHEAEPHASHGFPHRLALTVPPLAAVWLVPER